jgi:3-methylcrotonyl-CoA carboxylase alpha subunit
VDDLARVAGVSWRVDSGVRAADGTWRLRLVGPGDTRRTATGVVTPEGLWIAIDGEVHHFAPARPAAGTPRSRRTADHPLAAPMPATVIKVLVSPGQEVAAGDVLLLLEAMKMELPVRAPRSGRVKSISCEAGELVQPGVTLAELDDAAT